MNEIITDMTTAYLQTGFMGMFCIVGMVLLLWYFTKGRKQQADERDKAMKEQGKVNTIIENCTSVIQNNTEVIKMNTQIAVGVREDTQRVDEHVLQGNEMLNELLKNQAICMDRQNRK